MRIDGNRLVYWPSELDEFRLFQSGVQWNGEDEYTPEDFIRKLTEREESDAMTAGTALHKILENAAYGTLENEIKQDGWTITFDIDAEVRLPPHREIKLSRDYRDISVRGKVDGIDAAAIHDTKATKSIDVDAYVESYQWRTYLWMSDRRRFIYDLFRVSRDEKRREMVVKEYVALPLTAYPSLSADVESLLVEFDAAVKALGIPEIMRKKQMTAYLTDPTNLIGAG